MTDTLEMTVEESAKIAENFAISFDDPNAPYGRNENGEPLAPYGYKADGTPAKKRGRQRQPDGPRTATAPKPRRSPGRPQTKGTDYRPGINGLLQIAAFPLAVAGRFNPSFALDAAAVTIHGPNIAEALNETAKERPEVAAVLDKILQVGPYGLVIASLIPLVAQIAVNHDKLPDKVGAGMGAIPKKTLEDELKAQAEQMQAA